MALKLSDLRSQHAALLAEARTLEDAVKITELMDKADAVAAQIKALLRLEAAAQGAQTPAAPPTAVAVQPTVVGADGETQPAQFVPDGGEGARALDGLTYDSKAWRTVEVETPMGARKVKYYMPLGQRDGKPAELSAAYGRAFEVWCRLGKDRMGPVDRKALTEGVDTAGGFLAPDQIMLEVIKKQATMAVIRSLARVVNTSRDVIKLPRVNYSTDDLYTSGVRLTWTGETPSSSTAHRVTDQVIGQIAIPVHTAMASQLVSNDLLEDAAYDVMGMSSELFGEAYALGEEDTFWDGTGAGQPTGIITEPDGNGPTSVASGSASTLTAGGLIDLFYAVPAQYRIASTFAMNSATMKVVEKLVDGQGRYLVSSLVNGSLASPAAETIKGKRVAIAEFAPDVGTNTYPIVFGDWKGYFVVDRVGLSIKRDDSLYSETNYTLLLARKRVGGYCAAPFRFRLQKCSA